jgi:hypothetical protein
MRIRVLTLVASDDKTSSGQHFPDFPRQLIYSERLANKLGISVEHAVMDNRILRIAGSVKHFQARLIGTSLVGKLPSGHAGHHNVCQKQCHGPGLLQ